MKRDAVEEVGRPCKRAIVSVDEVNELHKEIVEDYEGLAVGDLAELCVCENVCVCERVLLEAMKRDAVEEVGQRAIVSVDEVNELHKEIVEYYEGLAVGDLAELCVCENVPRPSLLGSAASPHAHYLYIGRPAFLSMYKRIVGTAEGWVDVTGSPGSGKSILTATLAGLLHEELYQSRPVIYILGSVYPSMAFECLLAALQLAFAAHGELQDELGKLSSLSDLWSWLYTRRKTRPLIFVDDYNKLEKDPELKWPFRAATSVGLVVVTVRRESFQYRLSTSHPPGPFIRLSGPFTMDEAGLWMTASNVAVDPAVDSEGTKKRHAQIEYFTGRIPRLMRFYLLESSDWSINISQYAQRLLRQIRKAEAGELRVIQKFAAGSTVGLEELADMDMTCFFLTEHDMESYIGRFLCPYLAEVGQRALRDRSQALQIQGAAFELGIWESACKLDANSEKSNNARMGWTAEQVVISTIVLSGGFSGMKHSKVVYYDSASPLASCSAANTEGILFVPKAFNEKAVDIVFRIKVGDRWKVTGIQITVAKWKDKVRKNSHGTWKDLYSKWIPEGEQGDLEFVYIMKQKNNVADPSYPDRLTPSALSVDWNSPTVFDGMSTRFLQFKDVHPRLSFIDISADVEEVTIPKPAVRSCKGTKVNGQPCGRKLVKQRLLLQEA